MENLDLAVLRSLAGWIADGHRTLLATVRTWGSSPRPVGSIMAHGVTLSASADAAIAKARLEAAEALVS